MIIVSQTNTIVNFNNIVEIKIKDSSLYNYKSFKIYAYTISNKEIELGKYSTKSRAKTILNKMINKYLECSVSNDNRGMAQACVSPRAYIMPY